MVLSGELLRRNGWEYAGGLWVLKGGKVRLGWSEKDGSVVLGYALVPLGVRTVERMNELLSLLDMESLKGMSVPELEQLLDRKMAEVYRLRQEIDRRKGDVPVGVDVDFEKYVTE